MRNIISKPYFSIFPWIFLLSVILILSGCSKHVINYDIGNMENRKMDRNVFIAIDTFQDERPIEECKGSSGKFLAFASKDDDFAEPPSISITNLLREELQKSGLKVIDEGTMGVPLQRSLHQRQEADYRLSGEILHFQTMVKLPGTTVIPYLGTVATLWESDEYTTIVTIRARLMQHQQFGAVCSPSCTAKKEIVFEREFNISENFRLKTGILNLERWFGRGMDYKFKLLDMALADVLRQIRDEVIKTMNFLDTGKPDDII